jgi:hypothetical protein
MIEGRTQKFRKLLDKKKILYHGIMVQILAGLAEPKGPKLHFCMNLP